MSYLRCVAEHFPTVSTSLASRCLSNICPWALRLAVSFRQHDLALSAAVSRGVLSAAGDTAPDDDPAGTDPVNAHDIVLETSTTSVPEAPPKIGNSSDGTIAPLCDVTTTIALDDAAGATTEDGSQGSSSGGGGGTASVADSVAGASATGDGTSSNDLDGTSVDGWCFLSLSLAPCVQQSAYSSPCVQQSAYSSVSCI